MLYPSNDPGLDDCMRRLTAVYHDHRSYNGGNACPPTSP